MREVREVREVRAATAQELEAWGLLEAVPPVLEGKLVSVSGLLFCVLGNAVPVLFDILYRSLLRGYVAATIQRGRRIRCRRRVSGAANLCLLLGFLRLCPDYPLLERALLWWWW